MCVHEHTASAGPQPPPPRASMSPHWPNPSRSRHRHMRTQATNHLTAAQVTRLPHESHAACLISPRTCHATLSAARAPCCRGPALAPHMCHMASHIQTCVSSSACRALYRRPCRLGRGSSCLAYHPLGPPACRRLDRAACRHHHLRACHSLCPCQSRRPFSRPLAAHLPAARRRRGRPAVGRPCRLSDHPQ